MYFYIKPINHHTYYNREALALVKNLQSLGVGATGNLGIDRANLQKAEYEKLQKTLSPSNEQNIQNAKILPYIYNIPLVASTIPYRLSPH